MIGRSGRSTLLMALAAGVLPAVVAGSALAQVAPSPNTPKLIAAANGNPQLTSTAAYIGVLCPNLTPGTDLRLRCAAALAASATAPPLASEALTWITPQELLAQSAVVDGAVMPATSAVASRLSALGHIGRGGIASAYRPVLLATAGDTAGLGGASAPRLQGFANVVGGKGDKDTNTYETGYNFDQRSFTVGADYRFSDTFTAGLSASYGDTKLDFEEAQGTLKAKAWVGTVYGLWSVSDRIQVTGLLAYGRIKYAGDRTISYAEPTGPSINRIAHSDTHGDQFEGTLTASYSMAGGDGWSYGPSLSLSGRTLDLNAFEETGASGLNLSFAKQSTDSVQVIAGFDVSKAISTQTGIVSPYARIQGIYETRDNRRDVRIKYVADTTGFFPGIRLTTSAPDRTRFLVGGGLAGQFTGGWSAFVDAETILGLKDVSGYNLTLGVRKEF